MCSVLDDEKDDLDLIKPGSCSASQFCVKCKTSSDVILIKSDESFCRSCFIMRTTHKFRSEFGKSRLIRDKEKVLVAYSGGLCSSALLQLVQEGLSKKALKKLRFCPSVVYIDDELALPKADRVANLNLVARKLHSTDLPYYIYCLDQENACNEPLVANDRSDPDFNLDSALDCCVTWQNSVPPESLFASVKTETSKESLAYLLRNQLLANVARTLSVGKVIVGDIANGLAVRILSYIAQGRGDQLPYEMSFADERYSDIVFLRPMRNFTARELEVFCNLNQIESLQLRHSVAQVDDFSSIASLSRAFVSTLQASHDNTVPIICRTAEKLVIPDESAITNCKQCILCKGPVDKSIAMACTSQDAPLNNGCNLDANEDCEAESAEFTPEELLLRLCYGCRRIAQEMTDVRDLQKPFLKETVIRRLQMQRAVKDFLITDEGSSGELS